jgi:tripartite-type tricarboxylate transporter receptor subunit TctC
MSEAVPGFEGVAWIMFKATARTPPQIVDRLRAELVPIMAESEVQTWIVQGGLIPPRVQAPDELQQLSRLGDRPLARCPEQARPVWIS